ncbi:MAG TPA: hypothetical protein VGN15_08655 [Ktedonobacteraceae bacterium]|jgi:hypothetical protein|nr:hypothetical protein [Ktedonobacteraceae bacterium]
MITEPKPSAYVVYYVDNASWEKEAARVGEESVDPANTEKELYTDYLDYAQYLREQIETKDIGSEVRIYKRVDVHPVTSQDGAYTRWEWEEELVED